ncbi:hypothetical protein BDR06DRAFT_964032 [Suillus hirtellus]|nr:hypothetical protein BDR06DRAFT_964032 [Suillus hirtellus]
MQAVYDFKKYTDFNEYDLLDKQDMTFRIGLRLSFSSYLIYLLRLLITPILQVLDNFSRSCT